MKVLENLLFHSNISYTAHDHDFSSAIGTALAWGYRQPPWAPLYTPSGKFYSWQGYGNPAQELEEGGNTLMPTLLLLSILHWTGIFYLN